MVPKRSECLKLMEQEGMPSHIIAHSKQVEAIAIYIGKALNSYGGYELDMDLIIAGALLHDIRKIHSIREGGNHAKMGAEFVSSLGFTEVAPLVLRHVDLGEWVEEPHIDEAEIINYADKRVRHDEVVSLEERFVDLLKRYGVTDRAKDRINYLRDEMFRLEEKLFGKLPFGPEKVLELM